MQAAEITPWQFQGIHTNCHWLGSLPSFARWQHHTVAIGGKVCYP